MVALKSCALETCNNEFESGVANKKYCSAVCKRTAENVARRLPEGIRTKQPMLYVPGVYDEEKWQKQEDRKMALAMERQQQNAWILKNKSFAMFDIEATNLDADIGEMLCACIKPLGGKVWTTQVVGVEQDRRIANEIREELKKYDYICTWYGTGYDMPFVTTRLMAWGDEPLGHIRHVDLYYTARWQLKLHSNRLASVAEFMFGKTQKDRVIGPIWNAAMRGDANALKYITTHCEKDVKELERVFLELVPYRNLAGTPLKKY